MTIILWLLAAAFLGLTLAMRRAAARTIEAAAHWPTAEGRIVESAVRQNGNGTYKPEISYAYSVDGQGYANDRLRPGGTPFFYSERKAYLVAAAYDVGDPVTVYYPPRKPGRPAIQLVAMSHAQVVFGAMTLAVLAIAVLVSLPQ